MKKLLLLFFLVFFLFTKMIFSFSDINELWNDQEYLNKILNNSDLQANSENKEKLKMAFSRALVILRDSLNDENKEDDFPKILAQKWAEEFAKLLHEDLQGHQLPTLKDSRKKRIIKWSLAILSITAVVGFIYWFFWHRKKPINDKQIIEEFRQTALKTLQRQEEIHKKQKASYKKEVDVLKLKHEQQKDHIVLLHSQVDSAIKSIVEYQDIIDGLKEKLEKLGTAIQVDVQGLVELRKDVYGNMKSFADALISLGNSSPKKIKAIVGHHEDFISERMTRIDTKLDSLRLFDQRITSLENIDHRQNAQSEVVKITTDFLDSFAEKNHSFEHKFNFLADRVDECVEVVNTLLANEHTNKNKKSGTSILPDFKGFVAGLGQITKLTKSVRYLSDEIRKLKGNYEEDDSDLFERINLL